MKKTRAVKGIEGKDGICTNIQEFAAGAAEQQEAKMQEKTLRGFIGKGKK